MPWTLKWPGATSGATPAGPCSTVTAIAFACILLVFMFSFQLGSYETMINASVTVHTGHLQVQARGYQADNEIRLTIADPRPVQRVLDTIPEIKAHAPRARAFALISSQDRSYGIMVEGIDPAAEKQVSTLASIVRQGN